MNEKTKNDLNGLDLNDEGKFIEAEKYLEELVRKNPTESTYKLELGMCLKGLGKIDRAQLILHEASLLQNGDTNYICAAIYSAIGSYIENEIISNKDKENKVYLESLNLARGFFKKACELYPKGIWFKESLNLFNKRIADEANTTKA